MLVQYGDFYMHMVTAPLVITTCQASIEIDASTAPEYVTLGQESMPHTIILAPDSTDVIKESQIV